MDPLLTAALILKAMGSLAGTILAFVFQPPRSTIEFISRTIFSASSGLVFGDPVHQYLNWPMTWQMDLAAAALTAMLSWFVMGAAVRVISRWMPSK